MSSFRRIDYSVRPAKHAERRMLCDIFRRLRPFGRVEDYAYIGFGSVWFSDFSLFHRALGVKKMLSIERAADAQARIEENKPFNIPVDYRSSTDVLPDLDWSSRMFIWLDYDDPLSPDMLQDLRAIARRANSGTAIAISVQCSKAPQVAEAEQDSSPDAPNAVARFVAAFGADRISTRLRGEDLYNWKYGKLCRDLMKQEIESELAARNSGHARAEMEFHPICDLEYEDGAKMVTIVGLFHSPDDRGLLDQCHFESLDFMPAPNETIRIRVPKLTVREFRRLESQLPLALGGDLQLGTIPLGEARRFESLYRYLPSFAVIEG